MPRHGSALSNWCCMHSEPSFAQMFREESLGDLFTWDRKHAEVHTCTTPPPPLHPAFCYQSQQFRRCFPWKPQDTQQCHIAKKGQHSIPFVSYGNATLLMHLLMGKKCKFRFFFLNSSIVFNDTFFTLI